MRLLALLLLTWFLAGCSTVSLDQPVPVVNRNVAPPSGPWAAHAGEPGYYTVQRGDTLIHIASRTGTDWHALVAWNGLSQPNRIEVGQVLRLSAPPAGTVPAPAASAPAAASGVAQSYALGAGPGEAAASAPARASAPVSAASPASAASHRAAPRAAASAPARAPSQPGRATAEQGATAAAGASHLVWGWPATGKVLHGYDGRQNKGLDIAGTASQPVVAAAAGRVVYAGNELRGYGNLVIVKHDADYISVYAHNERLLVKDGQQVKRGQQIALMGSSDAPRVELHFEVRLRGTPIDPMQVLPAR